MGEVRLAGELICADEAQLEAVRQHLPRHIELTRAEVGCLEFDVQQTDDPMVWTVRERFTDEAAFRRHQRRVADSEWGSATAGIERRYDVQGLPRADDA